MTTKIAIVGAGIVGTTAAYYLKQNNPSNEITIFDAGIGQATKAAAGIISPWLSKRRNQRWYHLARAGAVELARLSQELQLPLICYQNCGTIITRSAPQKLDELYELALQRRHQAPQIGEIKQLSQTEIHRQLPFLQAVPAPGILISGGSRLDGALFCKLLLEKLRAQQVEYRKGTATLLSEQQLSFKQQVCSFDVIILATGAWTAQVLEPLGIKLKVHPQKGQLLELQLPHWSAVSSPVLMPEAEFDLIPVENGRVLVGATHEDHGEFNLQPTAAARAKLLRVVTPWLGKIDPLKVKNQRVGTRAYLPDFAPCVGKVPRHEKVLIGTGLGSSGLTTGPMVGKLLADLVANPDLELGYYSQPVANYL
ncbi:oxidoreductase(EC 1.-) [Fructilactobacillus florum 8D]|uniref:Oxidoreductase(EC 1.-) n=1 Tax=Fructilactobacillus florum 8D TaxID=1221538 RepID=W9ELT6_9LACO|nr:FAD-dependent oxidoreductase [Fructilactobacillus florum]ETO40649.1 oxidoreductase(EC 1.-) [Fructilactobacillus florum 8D]